jgi:hypothetical protein
MEPEDTAAAEPLLLRLRSGRTAAIVIGGGIGGGMLLLGVATTAASAPNLTAVWNAILGYGAAILPLLVAAALIAVCRSELWLVPEKQSFLLLTFRPWRRGPRVEQAPLSEYAGVRTSKTTDDDGYATLVSLVTATGEDVPLRQFSDEAEAHTFAEKLAAAAGLWIRGADDPKPLEA